MWIELTKTKKYKFYSQYLLVFGVNCNVNCFIFVLLWSNFLIEITITKKVKLKFEESKLKGKSKSFFLFIFGKLVHFLVEK